MILELTVAIGGCWSILRLVKSALSRARRLRLLITHVVVAQKMGCILGVWPRGRETRLHGIGPTPDIDLASGPGCPSTFGFVDLLR